MGLAWETLLVQAQANRVTAEAQRDVAQANRVMAEAMFFAMREAKGCHDMPCQDDELQAWFHDAQGAAAIAQASMDSADGPHTPQPDIGDAEEDHVTSAGKAIAVAGLHGRQKESEGLLVNGDCTPPKKAGRRYVEYTPPRVPAFPATLSGSVEQQIVAWEAGGSSIEGIGNGKGGVGDTVSIEAVQGGMPRPPEHELLVVEGLGVHGNLVDGSSVAGGCSKKLVAKSLGALL